METTIVYWGFIGMMESKIEVTIVYWGFIGIMEKKMETTVVYWLFVGIMEQKTETTIVYDVHPQAPFATLRASNTGESSSRSASRRPGPCCWVAVKELTLSYHNGFRV